MLKTPNATNADSWQRFTIVCYATTLTAGLRFVDRLVPLPICLPAVEGCVSAPPATHGRTKPLFPCVQAAG
ncbi:MAG: hypothetical protein KDA71_13030, partial [Planctomycetales bacterium]|nr:hypothetical protein [Planctomycetales bacterium]